MFFYRVLFVSTFIFCLSAISANAEILSKVKLKIIAQNLIAQDLEGLIVEVTSKGDFVTDNTGTVEIADLEIGTNYQVNLLPSLSDGCNKCGILEDLSYQIQIDYDLGDYNFSDNSLSLDQALEIDETKHIISATILDQNDLPVSGIKLLASSLEDQNYYASAVSDQNGQVLLPGRSGKVIISGAGKVRHESILAEVFVAKDSNSSYSEIIIQK
jgi:hypothetical protein